MRDPIARTVTVAFLLALILSLFGRGWFEAEPVEPIAVEYGIQPRVITPGDYFRVQDFQPAAYPPSDSLAVYSYNLSADAVALCWTEAEFPDIDPLFAWREIHKEPLTTFHFVCTLK